MVAMHRQRMATRSHYSIHCSLVNGLRVMVLCLSQLLDCCCYMLAAFLNHCRRTVAEEPDPEQVRKDLARLEMIRKKR